MAMEKAADSLPIDVCLPISIANGLSAEEQTRLTHGNAEEADGNLNASKRIKDRFDAPLNQPLVRLEGQGKAEKVLEDDQAGEALNRKVA